MVSYVKGKIDCAHAFSFRGRFVCLKGTDTERSMRHVLNFRNKKAVPRHCFSIYRESGLVSVSGMVEAPRLQAKKAFAKPRRDDSFKMFYKAAAL